MTLVLGGARSGKSTFAQERASQPGGEVLFVATANPSDQEMADRIAAHRAQRPTGWRTLEVDRDVGASIEAVSPQPNVILLDCMTLLAGRALIEMSDPSEETLALSAVGREVEGLLAAYGRSEARWILVTNEVGMGLVPETPLGRAYRDSLGWANQRLAQQADEVVLMVAGLPLWLKRAA